MVILQVQEPLMKRYNIQPTSVPTLKIFAGNSKIEFIPSALWIIGANGRIDLSIDKKQFYYQWK
jgi:hypothetical protein